MKPNSTGQHAYRRGYTAGHEGKSESDNPYQYRSRSRGGIGLSAWWSAGLVDYRIGQPQRWTT